MFKPQHTHPFTLAEAVLLDPFTITEGTLALHFDDLIMNKLDNTTPQSQRLPAFRTLSSILEKLKISLGSTYRAHPHLILIFYRLSRRMKLSCTWTFSCGP